MSEGETKPLTNKTGAEEHAYGLGLTLVWSTDAAHKYRVTDKC